VPALQVAVTWGANSDGAAGGSCVVTCNEYKMR